MNREQWQRKRGPAGTPPTPKALTAIGSVPPACDTTQAAASVKPAASASAQQPSVSSRSGKADQGHN
jgi:hypothetical protein